MVGTKWRITGTFRNDTFKGAVKQEGFVPSTWTCTLSAPDSVTTFDCQVDQPKYYNVKAQHFREVWTHE